MIPVDERTTIRQKINALTECLIKIFTEADLESFHTHSYKKASEFLTKEVEQRWKKLIQQQIPSSF